jgi:hypothetical protein
LNAGMSEHLAHDLWVHSVPEQDPGMLDGLNRASGFFTHLLELNMGRTRWYRRRPMQLLCFIVGLMTPSPRTTYRR